MSESNAMARKSTRTRKPTMADQADKYELYLASVQEPSVEVAFFDRVFRKEYKRPPMLLREDFAGTAAVCYEWVQSKPDRKAIAVDLDPEPLTWGQEHLAPKLPEGKAKNVTILEQDVRKVNPKKVDVLAAQNFSFYIFQTRKELLEYFKAARRNLAKEGVMVLDMVGGPEAMEEDREEKQ
ncbi:MAG: class I SAM-dependent methyltransferase, partial [Phycisphaeraceae bacterium]